MANQTITAHTAVARAATGEITLLDVREHGEVQASGTAAGAIHIPLALIPMKTDPRHPDFDKRLAGKPIAVFCAAGARSGRAVQVMRDLGHDAHNIGGFGDWCSAGGKVQR
jgi:rhodanese-related sulfurtransferase